MDKSITGIPIDILWSALGALVLLVYFDLRREVRRLRREAGLRNDMLHEVKFNVIGLCRAAGIKFISLREVSRDE
jgi:hypothetical protein